MKKKIFLFILIISYTIFSILISNKNIKICICTIGKKENLYAREYVEFYKKKGVDKIIIYDNNEKEGEKFNLVLKDYIDNKYVEIIDVRGIVAPQVKAMEDCRKNNYKKFDWLIFFDMDEFIFLRKHDNIKDFLGQRKFTKCQRIQLNWFFHTDNNLIYYDNRTLQERFPVKERKWKGKKLGGLEAIKSIIRGNIDVKISNIHYINDSLISCDGFGRIRKVYGIYTKESDHYYNYIDHYFSKSTEEFVNKLMKGSVSVGYNKTSHSMNRINIYFFLSDITLDKINYIENRTNFNLTKFRLKLKS